ncbi:MAG: HAD family hydrolase [Syntrophomonadaceae bacterium]|nr:HAD family hydrolase [Syntrophomonadaceae bacterium]
MLKAITFDFWDTLYKTPDQMGTSLRRINAFADTLQDLGYKAEHEAISQAFYDCWQYANHYQIECGLDITPRGHVDFILKQLRIELNLEDWNRVYNTYTKVLANYPPQVNHGVYETLPLLAEKFKLAVICNTGATPGKLLREIMKADDIFKYFAFALFSDEVQWAKPNVKIFAYALEKLDIPGNEAAHVGDNRSTDVAGAKRAGMRAIWLAPAETAKCEECDFQIREIKELLSLLVHCQP